MWCFTGKQQEKNENENPKQQQLQQKNNNLMIKDIKNINNIQDDYIKKQQSHTMLGISLVIARNNQGKFLTVKENYDQGWWIPGGLVDPPEDFITAAIRETKEEAGIDVEIKGILRIEQSFRNNARYKVVFYAEPIDQKQIPKQIPDSETQEARWVTLEEMVELGKSPPYLRGKELLKFGTYILNNGPIYPLDILQTISVPQFVHKLPLQVDSSIQINNNNYLQTSNNNKNQQTNNNIKNTRQIIENRIKIEEEQKIEYINKTNNNNNNKNQMQSQSQYFNETMKEGQENRLLGLSLIVVRNKQNKYLAVREKQQRGWWLPGGKVDPPEDFLSAGIRETKEEAGIDVQIKGILRIEQEHSGYFFRYKVVFYAEPIDEKQIPKQIADSESEEARWVTIPELKELGKQKPYLRGRELIQFGEYLEKGGIIYPLDVINTIVIQ